MSLLPSSFQQLRSVFKKDEQPRVVEQPHEHEALRQHRAATSTLRELIFAARINDDEQFDCATEIAKEILGSPDYRHKTRLVAEHYDYVMTLPIRFTPKGAKMTPAAAINIAANCTTRRGLTKEQERALAYLEASKFMWTEGMTFPMKAHRYPSGTRELVAERPQDVLRIIEVARAHPEITRKVELEALLEGQTLGVLVEGVL
jgi:hypothetical protein